MESKKDVIEMKSKRVITRGWKDTGGKEERERLVNRCNIEVEEIMSSGVQWHSRVNVVNNNVLCMSKNLEERTC
jgi:hypothetical protein